MGIEEKTPGQEKKKWKNKSFDRVDLVTSFLNELEEKGISPDDIKISSAKEYDYQGSIKYFVFYRERV